MGRVTRIAAAALLAAVAGLAAGGAAAEGGTDHTALRCAADVPVLLHARGDVAPYARLVAAHGVCDVLGRVRHDVQDRLEPAGLDLWVTAGHPSGARLDAGITRVPSCGASAVGCLVLAPGRRPVIVLDAAAMGDGRSPSDRLALPVHEAAHLVHLAGLTPSEASDVRAACATAPASAGPTACAETVADAGVHWFGLDSPAVPTASLGPALSALYGS